jgi:hypothetical protein
LKEKKMQKNHEKKARSKKFKLFSEDKAREAMK